MMTREEALNDLKYYKVDHDLEIRDEVLEIAIESIETLNEIIDYMNDGSVTWRDISDDIINQILEDHGWGALTERRMNESIN